MIDTSVSLTQSGLDEQRQRIRRTLECLIGIAFTEGNAVRPPQRRPDLPGDAARPSAGPAHRRHDDVRLLAGRDRPRFADALSDGAPGAGCGSGCCSTASAAGRSRRAWSTDGPGGRHVEWFRKPLLNSPFKQNHRCHRKVLVVDERSAFTGGVGIAEEWCGDARNEGEWRDTHVEVRGPAVDGLAAAFAQNWAECHEELFDDGTASPSSRSRGRPWSRSCGVRPVSAGRTCRRCCGCVLESAEERVRIATAYFAPDAFFVDLLCRHRTARGGRGDPAARPAHGQAGLPARRRRRHYDELIGCGVRGLALPADDDARQGRDGGRRSPRSSARRTSTGAPSTTTRRSCWSSWTTGSRRRRWTATSTTTWSAARRSTSPGGATGPGGSGSSRRRRCRCAASSGRHPLARRCDRGGTADRRSARGGPVSSGR